MTVWAYRQDLCAGLPGISQMMVSTEELGSSNLLAAPRRSAFQEHHKIQLCLEQNCMYTKAGDGDRRNRIYQKTTISGLPTFSNCH